jgi:universal stress protein family protein
MSVTIDRDGARTGTEDHSRRRHGGPVVLATFEGARLDAQAARLAVESAADMRSTLFVVQVLETRPGRRGSGRATAPVPAALAATLAAATALAEEFGVDVVPLRVSSLRPVAALLEFVGDRRPALVVFATDPAALRRFLRPTRRQYRRFVAALTEQAACLLWTAEVPSAPAAISSARRDWWRKQAETARAALNSTAAPTAWSSSQFATANANRL